MATITFKKGDEYLALISKLEAASRDQICGSAIYGAAEIVTDAIREELRKVPTDERYGDSQNPTNGPRKAQKAGLYESLGIAPMRDDNGFLNVKVGFDGYNAIETAQYPHGQPNQLVARSVERGTYFMKENEFVKPAMRKAQRPAKTKMKETVDEEIKKIMEG